MLPAGDAAVRLGEVPPLRERQRPGADLVLEAARLGDAERDLVIDLLQHARHRGEHRRLDLGEVGDEAVGVGEVERLAPGDVADGERPREDVGHREERQDRLLLILERAQRGEAGEHVRRDVLVRQHDALRLARRAGRVDERREVGRLDLVAEFVGTVGGLVARRAPLLPKLIERHQADVIREGDAVAGALGQDRQRHVRQVARPGGEVGQHLRVGHEHGLGLAVGGHEDEVVGRVGGVQRHVHDARDQRPQVREDEVHVAVHEEGDVVASLQPVGEQPEGDLVGGVLHLGVGPRHPGPIRLRLVEGARVGVLLDGGVQQLGDRFAEDDLARGGGRGGVDLESHRWGASRWNGRASV